MKALSVLQPWAWAIVHGPKRIENRTWATRHRGPLLIHAGKGRQLLPKRSEPGRQLCLPDGTGVPVDELSFGGVIGVVDVVDCVPVADVKDDPFAEGPWCWVLENPRPIGLVPVTGQLMLFDVAEELLPDGLLAG